jgi:hypothetical protein
VWDYVSTLLGEVTANELALVAIIFFCVLAYTWAPKAGELIGEMFDQDGD